MKLLKLITSFLLLLSQMGQSSFHPHLYMYTKKDNLYYITDTGTDSPEGFTASSTITMLNYSRSFFLLIFPNLIMKFLASCQE